MQRVYLLFLLTLISSSLFAQSGLFEIEAYGDILYKYYNYGPNQNKPSGSGEDSRAITDIPRLVLEFKYHFTPEWKFTTEIEFEHGGTGSALELEYEEFGEYEAEIEKGGEVVLEQFHITRHFSKAFNVRVGHDIVPIGLLNLKHKAKYYFTSERPESERRMIPVTWHETGVSVFGSLGLYNYRFQLINGLDASGFSSERWIVEGNQNKFEQAKASDLAFVGHVGYGNPKMNYVGASIYYGNSTKNRQKDQDMKGIDGHVAIYDMHATTNWNGLRSRVQWLYGTLQNSDIISSKNSKLSKNIQLPRSPVAKAALSWSVAVGYDILPHLIDGTKKELYPFVRYSYYNTMEETAPTVYANPRFKRNILTFGINYFPYKDIVLKADYAIREMHGSRYNDEHSFGLSLGFSGDFLKYTTK